MYKIIITIFLIYFFQFNLPLYSFDKISLSVKIYSNGISVVNESYDVESTNKQVSLVITVPSNTILSTLNTFNLDNQQILIEQENISKLLHKNDSITVLLEDGLTFKGLVLNEHGWDSGDGIIILNVVNNSNKDNPIIIDDKKIISIQINQLANGEDFDYRQKELQKVKVSGVSKAKNIIVSYVTRKTFSWLPIYSLNLNNNEMNAYAIITSNYTLDNAKINLILGEPYFKTYYYEEDMSEVSYTEEEVLPPAPTPAPVVGLGAPSVLVSGEQWQYTFDGTINLKENQTNKLPLFSAELDVKDYYYWEGDKTLHMYKFTNKLDRPLPAGNIDFYRDNIWIGGDALPWTSTKEEGKVTAEYAFDVKIEEKTVSQKEEETKRTITRRIDINNYKNEVVELEIVSYLPTGANLVKANVQSKVEGSKLTWNVKVSANKQNAIEYTYEQLKNNGDYYF
jgi:hypothetical protein